MPEQSVWRHLNVATSTTIFGRTRGVAVFEGVLDQVEGGAAIGQDTAQFAVKVGALRRVVRRAPRRPCGTCPSSRCRVV